jgi:predicted flap endonuclease-1-like 5' DNA nuclease
MVVQTEVAKEMGNVTGSTLLDGAALVMVSPIVIPALLLGFRPVAKTVIKGSLFLTDRVKLFANTTSEGWSHWVAEARSEEQTATAPGTGETIDNQPSQTDELDDLQQLTGVGRKFAELLREAGVESIRALARRNAANLHEKLVQINEQQQIVSLVPSLELVTDWITQAQNETR